MRVPSGKISTASPRARIAFAVSSMSASPWPRWTGNAPSELRNHAGQPVAEQLLLGDVVHRAPRDRRDHERVEERAVVGGEDHGPALGHVLAPDPRQAEVEVEERLEHRAHEPVHERVDPALAVARVQVRVVGLDRRHGVVVISLTSRTRARRGRYSRATWPSTRTRTLRGALAGAAAAAVWAAQQPLDKRVFGVELRRRRSCSAASPACAATRRSPVGLALHVANGAAVRRRLRERGPAACPARRRVRGAAAGLAEHLATWPGGARDRPARPRPRLPAAVGQPARVRAGEPGATCCSAPCWASSSGG